MWWWNLNNEAAWTWIGLLRKKKMYKAWSYSVYMRCSLKVNIDWYEIYQLVTKVKYAWKSYIYWTVHHLDSWIKRETNLMSLALLFHYLLLNMFRMLIHPSSGACDLFGLYCSGSTCVGVTLKPASGYHTTPAKPHPEDGCINIRNMLNIK